jgi:Arc/MetJ family transcription regulator
MQTFRSQYGRKGIRVDDVVPTRSITRTLGRTHVGTPSSAVETMVRDQIASRIDIGATGWEPRIVEQTVRFALWRHAENLAEYTFVTGGVHR